MNILVTGGAGYIGSHTVIKLLDEGHFVVIYDNFCNSDESVVEKIAIITGVKPMVISGDVCDLNKLVEVINSFNIDAVMHFAGLKSVSESSAEPLKYYLNNVYGTMVLLEAMRISGVYRLVFSSSATVYGAPQYLPYDENHPTFPINPYGQTKLVVETLLSELAGSDDKWRIIALRYFNPVGAHHSGLVGENPKGFPNNLMPYLLRVAAREIAYLSVYGDDYPTKDGTGIRDYIHVSDLASGHIEALKYLNTHTGYEFFNLGSGTPYSVLEIIKTFERVNGIHLPYQIVGRREGDLPEYYACTGNSGKKMGWRATTSLEKMCESSWHFYKSIMSKASLQNEVKRNDQ